MLSVSGRRFLYGTRIGFLTTLMQQQAWIYTVWMAWSAGIMVFITTGTIIDELALCGIIVGVSTFILPQVLSTLWVKTLLSSVFLMSMLGVEWLHVGINYWTVFGIIANIVITYKVLQYTS